MSDFKGFDTVHAQVALRECLTWAAEAAKQPSDSSHRQNCTQLAESALRVAIAEEYLLRHERRARPPLLHGEALADAWERRYSDPKNVKP